VVNFCRPTLGARARRSARRVTWAAALAVVVVVVRAALGVWVAAGLVALAAVAGVIAALAVIEARVFDRPRRSAAPVVVPAPGLDTSDHVAFARALTAVAAAYLTACERQEHL
jgi:short subunit dehydrogenase-like uncharacterized protein